MHEMMNKREEDEQDIPLNFYVVQSPSSVSSSISPHLHPSHYHHHPHHLKLTPKPLPIINPLDHDYDDDDEEENVVTMSSYRNNMCKMKISNSSSLEMSRCSSSRASLTCISLDNDADHKNSLLTNHNKLDVIPLLPPHPHSIPNNHIDHHDNDKASIILLNAKNNEAYSWTEKFGKFPYHYYYHNHDEQINMQEEEEGEINPHKNDDDDKGCCCKYLSMNTYPASNLWIALQFLWRFLFSFSAALLVFYLATKPPPPYLSLQVGGVKEFEVAEGVDRSGVETNFLTCNISMLVLIDNNSKLFSLHLHPLQSALYYGGIPLVVSHQQLLEEDVKKVKNEEKKEIKVSIGVRGMGMYGAGREMQDELDDKSKGHLELVATIWVNSYYKIIPILIHPNFHHKAYCHLSIHNLYDQQHGTQAFNTTCRYSLS